MAELEKKPVKIVETILRDAHQSQIATRMTTEQMLPIVDKLDKVGYHAVECWGGATFDASLRFLHEDPWERLRKLRDGFKNTKLQMLFRGQNILGYRPYADDVVEYFVQKSAANGIDIIRIFDCLNDLRNLQTAVSAANKEKAHAQVALSYTLGDAYTMEYWTDIAKRIEDMGADSICIKDMAGLVKPYAAKKLISALKEELNIPVNLHTHDSTGNGVSTLLMASEAGLDIADCAIGSMSSMTSNPCMNSLVEALKGTERDTGLNPDELTELSQYYARIRPIYKQFESGMDAPNTEIYKYEIPGGQYSNLLAQVKEMGAAEDFEEIKGLYKDANQLLGNIVKVTPSSKVVGDFAIFMFKNGLTKENILEVGKDLSYPDSVVEYFEGMIGQPEGGFPEELQKIVLKDKKPIDVRPGSLLPDEDFDYIAKGLKENFYTENMEDPDVLSQKTLSYALYPKVYEDYCRHFEAYNDVTELESHVYFYGLRKGEETTLKLDEGKYLIIKFIDMTEPDEDGYRLLDFEVNGSIREIKVLDKNLEVKTDRRVKADKSNPAHLGSTIPGTVGKVLVNEGDEVTVNMPLMTVEAMKMETTVVSTVNGKVDKIYVKEGEQVNQEDLLISFEIDE